MLKKDNVKNFFKDKEKINSILIAMLLMSGLTSLIIKVNNIIPIIILSILVSMEVINYKDTMERIKNRRVKIQNIFLVFAIIVFFMFIISIINNGLRSTCMDRFLYFVVFIIIPYLCCRHSIKTNYVINSILIISLILSIPLFFINFGNYNGGTRMTISYYMLPTYIAMIMTFIVDKNKTKEMVITKIVLILIFSYPYIKFLIEYASRGVILAIAVCILLCIIINKKKLKDKLLILFFVLILGITSGIWFKPLVISTNNILQNLNIRIEVIEKSAKLIENDKFDDGRDKVYSRAIEGIIEHPLIGNGIGDYAEKYVTYPHNILLQALYEGGIIFFWVMLLILLYSIYILIFDNETEMEKKYLLVMFISIAIIRLMLSYEFWHEISFGLYLYVVFDIMQNNIDKRRQKNGKCDNSYIQKSKLYR